MLSCGGGGGEGEGRCETQKCRGSIMFSMILLRDGTEGLLCVSRSYTPVDMNRVKRDTHRIGTSKLQTNKPRDTKIQSARIHVKNTLTCKKQNICF